MALRGAQRIVLNDFMQVVNAFKVLSNTTQNHAYKVDEDRPPPDLKSI